MILDYLQKNEKKIGFSFITILAVFVTLALVKKCKSQPYEETKQILSKEQKLIDSLSRVNILLENKNLFLGNTIKEQDSQINKLTINYQNKKQVSKQIKIEYKTRDSLIVGIDTTCEKYVVSLENENTICDDIIKEKSEQINTLKTKDTVTTLLLDNTKKIIESERIKIEALKQDIKKRTKLFSISAGPGVTYTTDKEIKAGIQITTGIKLIEF